MFERFPRGEIKQDLTQFAVLILYNNSIGCGEMGHNCATEADTMIGIVCAVALNKE